MDGKRQLFTYTLFNLPPSSEDCEVIPKRAFKSNKPTSLAKTP